LFSILNSSDFPKYPILIIHNIKLREGKIPMLLKKFLGGKLSLLVLALLIGFLPWGYKTQASSPQIQKPRLLEVEITREKQLHIQGLTELNTKILVYIDDNFKNYAKIKEEIGDKVNSFSYLSGSRLDPGRHNITVVSQDKNSSLLSPPANYEVAVYGQTPQKMPTYDVPEPILLSPQSKNLTNFRPKITGLTANHTKVDLYLDGQLLEKTGFLSHPSGTAGFVFIPSKDLSPGKHELWAVAINSTGQRSSRSNYIDFNLRSVQGDKTSSPQDPESKPESKENSPTQVKSPQILMPANGSSVKLEDLVVKAEVNQIVEKIDVYMDGSLKESLIPTIKNNNISEINYEPEELARGSHNLYLVSRKNGQTSSDSAHIRFIVLDPQINNAVREENSSTTPENPETGTTSTSSAPEDSLEDPQTPTSTSSAWFSQDTKRYLIFGGIIIAVLLVATWSNRDIIKKMLKK